MHVAAIETVHLAELHRLGFVFVHTDEGLCGIGETYDKARTSLEAVHEVVAPLVLGRDGRDIAGLSHLVRDQISFHGRAGAELRGWSAVEMALWDLRGKALGEPVYRLLGGRCRDRVPVYNTCVSHGPIRDHERFEQDPAGLAEELLAEGYRAAKIWPFDRASERTLGQRLERAELEAAAAPVKAMRRAGLEVGIELHGRWTLPAAIRIAKALEPLEPLFLEEAIPAGQPQQLHALRQATTIPLVGSEWLLCRDDVFAWLQAGATSILMTDPSWNGGLLESLRIAAIAESFGVPLVFHSCGGPLTHAAALHLGATLPNLYAVETVRSFQRAAFPAISDVSLQVVDGHAALPSERPGLGVELADLAARHDATVRRSTSTRRIASGRYSVGDCWDDPAWAGPAREEKT